MMYRTHLTFAFLIGSLIWPLTSKSWFFFPVLLIATLLPDIDCMHSYLGKHWIFRPVQWCVKHRGLVHSMTFCILVTIVLLTFAPVLALPFFLGYAMHLLGDAITVDGVEPWWPLKKEVRGSMRTGGRIEKILFAGFCLLILIFWFSYFKLI